MKYIYLLLTFITFTATVSAQTKGISYQAVLYDPNYKNQPLLGVDNALIPYADKPVCLQFQITDKDNRSVYIETQKTKTDQFGMVNLIIGQGVKTGGLVSSFEKINWNDQANSLIVSLDNSGNCIEFKEVSSQAFTASPFSLGTTSINTADYELISNKSNNIIIDAASTSKYPSVKAVKDYVDAQNISAGIPNGSITSAKIANTTIINEDVADNAAIDFTKLNIRKSDVLGLGIVKADLGLSNVNNTSDADKQVSTATQAALNLKANILELTAEVSRATTAETALAADIATNATAINTNTTNIAANTIAITAEATTARAAETTLNTNLAAANTAIGLKESLSNKSTDMIADASSTEKYPSVKLVKDYVDTYVKDITSNEIALTTKINGKQLYAITGQFTASGSSALISILKPTDITDYYSLTTFKDGKTYRKQIVSFDLNATTNNVVTGQGFLIEVYPAGTYTYVLEYFK